jgi:hypothetical protein
VETLSEAEALFTEVKRYLVLPHARNLRTGTCAQATNPWPCKISYFGPVRLRRPQWDAFMKLLLTGQFAPGRCPAKGSPPT